MTSKSSVQPLDKARRDLQEAYRALGTWRAVASKFGIPPGTACAVAKGREPKSASVRKALGLPVLHLAPACPACGVVHVSKRCPSKRKAPSGPRFNRKQAAANILGVLWSGRKD